MNEDYLDEDDLEQEDGYLSPVDESEEDSDESSSVSIGPIDSRSYEGRLSTQEIDLIDAYNKIAACTDMEEATMIVVANIPKHTSKATQSAIVKQLFQKQGHSRLQNTKYTPQSMMSGHDVDVAIGEGEDDNGFNEDLYQKNKDFIARFIKYLAERDLSRDSRVSRAKKQRMIPAFIIYLFSSGAFGYIIDCPTMPPEYQELIVRALREINKTRFSLVEELAKAYEDAGRPKVAERVRKDGVGWFSKEPKEIYNAATYRDLELTMDDVEIYRGFRARYVNTTNSITKEVISDYIYVIQDLRKGTYQKLKDKTRAEAISDVKKEFDRFAKTYGDEDDKRVANSILF
jgi:hypothetical protein